MRYDFNGKMLNIPDAELERSMRVLKISKEEAIEMWLDDEGYLENEEQLELEQKAKENRITATIHDAGDKAKRKQSKPKTVKVSDEKQELFSILASALEEVDGKMEILKPNKLIQMEINGKIFKIDLIEQRAKKN